MIIRDLKYIISNSMNQCLLLVLNVVFVSVLFAEDGKFPIKTFNPVDYQAGNQNIYFSQNRNLNVFVANNLGVLSYNGTDWKNHGIISGKKVRSLHFDEETNRLYIGSQGEFGYYSNQWEYHSLLDLLPENQRDFDDVWDIYQLGSSVYFCTSSAIYVYSNEQFQIVQPSSGAFSFCFLVRQTVYVQDEAGELFELNTIDSTNHLKQVSVSNTADLITGMVPYEGGALLFYRSGTILFFSPYDSRSMFPELEVKLQGSFVNDANSLTDGRIVIATQTKGVFIFNPISTVIEQISMDSGLLSNACLTSYQDFQGNLWLGMQNGIALVDINSPLRLINEEIGLEGSGYDLIHRQEGTYYSTSNGIYFLPNGSKISRLISGTGGPAYHFKEIAGKLYVGHHLGLFQVQNGSAKLVKSLNGLWDIKLLKSKANYVLGGTYTGFYMFKISQNNELISIGPIQGFEQSSKFFVEDKWGHIWVSQFNKGLYKLSFDSIETLEAQTKRVSDEFPDLPLQNQVFVTEIDGEIWLATSGGVYKLSSDGNTITAVDFVNEQINYQPVYLLDQDPMKNIVIVTSDAVGIFKKVSNENFQYLPSSLEQLRFYFNNDLLNLSSHSYPYSYISANEGFIRYDLQSESQYSIESPIFVQSVYSRSLNKQLYRHSDFEVLPSRIDKLTLSQKDKAIQIQVETDAFDQTKQEFRYILKGFDDQFSEWTTSNTKEYTNLPDGSFEFIAESRNYLAQVSQSTPITITMKPPFYRSGIAKFIYVLLILYGLYFLYQAQNRTYQNRQRELDEKRKNQVAQEKQLREEMEATKEQQLKELEEEKLQAELRHTNNLLAASTMNLVVKNEFIETIKEELKEVQKKGKPEETRRAISRIVKGIDTNLKLQEDWEQFEFHFDQVHGDFLNRLRSQYSELTPQDQKLCAYLRLHLNTKEIAQLMSISVRGVEVARYRLRKRLGLSSDVNLSKFILEF